MGKSILVIGDSGGGKSTSLRTLDSKTSFLINVIGKPLPFRGWKKLYQPYDSKTGTGNLLTSSDWEQITNAIKHINGKKQDIKVIVIDDAQYIMGFEYMARANESGWDKFVQIQTHFFDILKAANATREDLTVVFLAHSDSSTGITRMKTIGKMLDEKITIEGLFSVVLLSGAYVTSNGKDKIVKYSFFTQTNGTTVAKSPMGMFEEREIPNDLNFVLTEMNKYYEGE